MAGREERTGNRPCEEAQGRLHRVAARLHRPLQRSDPTAGREQRTHGGPVEKLSTGERKQAYDKVDPYYFSLNNTNFCYQAAKYLEYKIFENEFVN